MKKVKCIKADDYGYIKVGNIYEVISEYTMYGEKRYTLRGVSFSWFASSFVDVSEGPTILGIDLAATGSKHYDPNQECPCGLRAAQCTYHKGS
jgi:hypothetical protein